MLTLPLLIGSIGWPELLLLALVILLVFGAKRIPDLMKSIGKGVRSFKDGISDIDDQINSEPAEKKSSAKKDE